MKNSDTLVMTVYYKGAESYAADYFKSIKNQNTNQFDLLIINDNIASFKLSGLNINVNKILISERISPSMIRFYGLRYALDNGYCNLIFSDIDDYFSDNRISLSIRELKKNNFVFNEISLINQNGELIEEKYLYKISVPKYINSFSQIRDYNYLGLTHTGINLKSLNNFYIPKDIIAVDWWIFTILLLMGATGMYVDKAITYYRQSDDNLVGIKKPLNGDRLNTGIKVKQAHYLHVLEYCKENNLESAIKDYTLKKEEMVELKSALEDVDFKERYIEVVNKNLERIYRGWWSEIVTLDDWRTYAI